MSGIYKIINKINNLIYIGSSVNIKRRFIEHKSTLNRKKHGNPHLQNAWNLYGEKSFSFEIIEFCSKESLLEKEKYWILQYNSLDRTNGYNIIECLDNPFRGKKLSLEHRKKLCEKRKSSGGGKPPKKVQCIETNKIYDSIGDAAKDTNSNRFKISSVCSGDREHHKNLHWRYI